MWNVYENYISTISLVNLQKKLSLNWSKMITQFMLLIFTIQHCLNLNSLFHEKVFLHEIFRNIKINPVLQLIFLRCKFNIVSKNSINLCYIHLLLYVTDNARLCMTFFFFKKMIRSDNQARQNLKIDTLSCTLTSQFKHKWLKYPAKH